MKIIFTHSFLKILASFGNIDEWDIKKETIKHKNWLNNFVKLTDLWGGIIILKGYLLSNKIRLILMLKIHDGIYVPVFLFKKESKMGNNIRKDDDEMKKKILSGIQTMNTDMISGKYDEYEL